MNRSAASRSLGWSFRSIQAMSRGSPMGPAPRIASLYVSSTSTMFESATVAASLPSATASRISSVSSSSDTASSSNPCRPWSGARAW